MTREELMVLRSFFFFFHDECDMWAAALWGYTKQKREVRRASDRWESS